MSEEKPKKGNRMVIKTVRLTPETHELAVTLADLLNVPISDALKAAINKAFPDAADEAERRKQWKEEQLKNEND